MSDGRQEMAQQGPKSAHHPFNLGIESLILRSKGKSQKETRPPIIHLARPWLNPRYQGWLHSDPMQPPPFPLPLPPPHWFQNNFKLRKSYKDSTPRHYLHLNSPTLNSNLSSRSLPPSLPPPPRYTHSLTHSHAISLFLNHQGLTKKSGHRHWYNHWCNTTIQRPHSNFDFVNCLKSLFKFSGPGSYPGTYNAFSCRDSLASSSSWVILCHVLDSLQEYRPYILWDDRPPESIWCFLVSRLRRPFLVSFAFLMSICPITGDVFTVKLLFFFCNCWKIFQQYAKILFLSNFTWS